MSQFKSFIILKPWFEHVVTNSLVRIRNCLNTDFWCNSWLESGPLLTKVVVPPTVFPSVADMWRNGQWQLDEVDLLLGDQLKSEILLSGMIVSEKNDKKVWKNSSSGLFSIKSAWSQVR